MYGQAQDQQLKHKNAKGLYICDNRFNCKSSNQKTEADFIGRCLFSLSIFYKEGTFKNNLHICEYPPYSSSSYPGRSMVFICS